MACRQPHLPENIDGSRWVVYTGTHDNPTTLGWWNNLDDASKEYRQSGQRPVEAPACICSTWLLPPQRTGGGSAAGSFTASGRYARFGHQDQYRQLELAVAAVHDDLNEP